MLVFDIKLKKDGKWFIAYIPRLDVESQAKTEKEALQMVIEALNLLLESDELEARATKITMKNGPAACIENTDWIFNFAIKRLRSSEGLTIQDVAKRAQDKSHTNYYRYEKFKVMMDIGAFDKYSKAIEGKSSFLIVSAQT